MATIYEVSKLAGVSLATVSRVINNSGKVAAATRKRVEDAMRELGYRPNSIAQSLASNRSNCVGVLVSELHGPIFGAMLGTIESELRHAGKFAIFSVGHNEAEREKQGIEFLASRNCDALILHVEALPTSYFQENAPGLLPFVLINRDDEPLRDNCIRLDNEQGGYLATRSVLELGHRRIGYISGPIGWGDADARIAGHRRALDEFGVAFDERLFVHGDYQRHSGESGTRRLLEADRPEDVDLAARFDGRPAAVVQVYRIGEQDVIEISEALKAYLARAKQTLPEGVALTIWQDDSIPLRSRRDTLLRNGRSGFLLVLLVQTLLRSMDNFALVVVLFFILCGNIMTAGSIVEKLIKVANALVSWLPGGLGMAGVLACGLFGISNDIAMQVVAVGFVISILQDSAETALNSSTDVVFTAAVAQKQM